MPAAHRLRRTLMVMGLCIGLAASGAGAQVAPPVVSGQVIDAFSTRPVAEARVQAGDACVTADAEGRFRLPVAAGMVRIVVTAAGYLPEQIDIAVAPGGVAVEILLVDEKRFAEDVVVKAGAAAAAPAASRLDVSPLEVRSVAGAAENVFRTLQTMPGVAAAEDFGSRLSVRGGGPDQNLTVVDGVEIHNPYRLFGLTSAFNPETVDRFELLAGGFHVKYGDRLSSILVIENRAGTRDRRLGGTASLSLTDVNAVAEGRLPRGGSWLVTGRRTYYDLVADRITGEELPRFADVQAKAAWEPRPGHRLAVSALRSREHTDTVFDVESTATTLGLTNASTNDLVSAFWTAAVGTRGSSRTVVAWYRYADTLTADGDLRNDSVRSNAPGDAAFGRAAVAFERTVGVRDLSVRQELTVDAGARHHIEVGGEVHALSTPWAWTITGDRNTNEANASSAAGGGALPSALDARPRSRRAAAWVSNRIRAGGDLQVEPGVRLDRGGLDGQVRVSPRIAVTTTSGGFTLRAAAGIFTQSPGYEKLLQADYFVDLTGGSTRLRSEQARHLVVSVERPLARGVVSRVEAYYKAFDHLIVGRLETPRETAARVALYDFPAIVAWSVPTAPQVTSDPVNGASGRAYGFDIYLARRGSRASDRWSGWASYTWGRADTDAYGRRYPLDYDRRHAVSVVGAWQAKPWVDIATTVRVASGFPYTPSAGLRVAANGVYDDAGLLTGYVPDRDPDGRYRWTPDPGGVATLNSAVLPVFARVDLRVTIRPSWSSRRWQFYAEVINLLNRRNAGALDAELEYEPASDRPRVTLVPRGGLPLLPSLGVRLRF